ncbi:MAG: Mur ligase family protein [Methanobacteriaceae archaeon]|nr:Mur ligase family protein [Methanobacteriaceae archaeon]
MDEKYDEKTSLKKDPPVFGVLGVCGIVGNLAARVLLDHGFKVIGSDLHSKEHCEYLYTLDDYDIKLYLSEHPEEFFKSSTHLIPPPSLSKDSDTFRKMLESPAQILEIDEIIQCIKPEKPVICITGTNGKTTTTHLLKHISRVSGLKTTEHGFKSLQGNVDYIPPLQSRLKGDVAVIETGTGGVVGDLKFTVEKCQPSCGIITNINPDHLGEDNDFFKYARIKGELLEELQNKKAVVNSDDPTVWGLLKEVGYKGEVITFGVDKHPSRISSKVCWCGEELLLGETISGVGYYRCSCGLVRPNPHYKATNIKKDSFLLHTPQGTHQVEMETMGLHNVYNALASIAVALEFLEIPLKDVLTAIKTFKGVPGRLEYLTPFKGKDIIVDYAHNPSGVETILQELKKIYSRMALVITVSSESGISGDIEILEKALARADFIIPASSYSYQAAKKYMPKEQILTTDVIPVQFREGTLGATSEQVLAGLKKAKKCDVDAIVCIGEAANKYKEQIKDYLSEVS